MGFFVRPQIYATMPVEKVKAQLRRGIMPAPFLRRMRVINIISAITLRKIEDNIINPFDVEDLHKILDKQISQDAIIAELENEGLKKAVYTGDLRPLWKETKDKPLLKKGFEQGWIQRFIEQPFDQICIMLALRAKLLLDAIDELGHSYNLLRGLGMGWIDFGEIPGEKADPPDSYLPPGIDIPIEYPEKEDAPDPGDEKATPTPGETDYVPPTERIPGDPGYETPSEAPTYTPTQGKEGGAGETIGSPAPPITLGFGPGAILGWNVATGNRSIIRPKCCISYIDPESFVSIGYITTTMNLSEAQGLTVEDANPDCGGENYEWIITAGGGSLSAESGLGVIYTAPSSGHNCPGNTEITLFCGGEIMDTLNITINYEYANAFDYINSPEIINPSDSELIYVIANNTPLGWSVEGVGFSLEHAATEGEINTLHADETGLGMALITSTGCEGIESIGCVNCQFFEPWGATLCENNEGWQFYGESECEIPATGVSLSGGVLSVAISDNNTIRLKKRYDFIPITGELAAKQIIIKITASANGGSPGVYAFILLQLKFSPTQYVNLIFAINEWNPDDWEDPPTANIGDNGGNEQTILLSDHFTIPENSTLESIELFCTASEVGYTASFDLDYIKITGKGVSW